jgi:hypothetical protein
MFENEPNFLFIFHKAITKSVCVLLHFLSNSTHLLSHIPAYYWFPQLFPIPATRKKRMALKVHSHEKVVEIISLYNRIGPN